MLQQLDEPGTAVTESALNRFHNKNVFSILAAAKYLRYTSDKAIPKSEKLKLESFSIDKEQ